MGSLRSKEENAETGEIPHKRQPRQAWYSVPQAVWGDTLFLPKAWILEAVKLVSQQCELLVTT